MTRAEFYDASTIASFEWPNEAQEFLRPLIEKGADEYVSNVKTRFGIIKCDDFVFPVTINEGEYANSYVVSNYFPIAYCQEKLPHSHPRLYNFLKPFIHLAGRIMQWMRINKVVIINNWLFSLTLNPDLSEKQVEAIREECKRHFPDHLVMFRNVNTYQHASLKKALKKNRFRLVASREIYLYDPELKQALTKKMHYHHRRDYRLIEERGFEIVRGEELTHEDLKRILELYNTVYIARYTHYSPQFTQAFLKHALETKNLELVALKKEGKVYGANGYFIKQEMMSTPFFGYDRTQENSGEIYRIMSVLSLKEAEKRDKVLNDGNGSESFKKYRGLKNYSEYTAVYVHHLPLPRRLFWCLAEKAMNWIAFPMMKRSTRRL